MSDTKNKKGSPARVILRTCTAPLPVLDAGGPPDDSFVAALDACTDCCSLGAELCASCADLLYSWVVPQ